MGTRHDMHTSSIAKKVCHVLVNYQEDLGSWTDIPSALGMDVAIPEGVATQGNCPASLPSLIPSSPCCHVMKTCPKVFAWTVTMEEIKA